MKVTLTRRRIAAAAVSLALAAGGVVAAGSPSSAAPVAGHCKVMNRLDNGRYAYRFPSLTAPTKYLSAHNCILNSGDDNSAVVALQLTLNACYLAGLTPDGVYGPKTKEAVRKAQAKAGLKGADVDGVYGPKTGNIIDWLVLDAKTDKQVKCDWFIVYM